MKFEHFEKIYKKNCFLSFGSSFGLISVLVVVFFCFVWDRPGLRLRTGISCGPGLGMGLGSDITQV